MHMNLGQGERQGEGRQQLGTLQMLPPQYYSMHWTQWDCNSTVAMTFLAMLAWAVPHQAPRCLPMLHLPSRAHSLHRGHCFPKAITATQGTHWPWVSWCTLSLNFGWQLQHKRITTKLPSSKGCSSSNSAPQEARTVDLSSFEIDSTQTLP